MSRLALDVCQKLNDVQTQISDLQWRERDLMLEVEQITGMPYEKFIDGMRRLLAPAKEATCS